MRHVQGRLGTPYLYPQQRQIRKMQPPFIAGVMWGQETMGPGGAGLEQNWSQGVFKPWESHPEISKSRIALSLPQACPWSQSH